MSRAGNSTGTPRAIIHKQILDAAESNPNASVEALADEVGSATPALVERVFEEYGDPAETQAMTQNGQTTADTTGPTIDQASADESDEADEPDEADAIDRESDERSTDPLADVSAKQRETLRLVHENPEASQADIAETLNVSRATVSRRLSDIPGFEWSDRATFTADLFDGEPGNAESPQAPESPSDDSPDSDVADGQPVDNTTVPASDADVVSVTLTPEFAHRIVHACVESDRISEEEELRLLAALLRA